jgi:hypothetical protein
MEIFVALLVSCAKALVITLLWGWFLVPMGLKPIAFWHAMGLVCTYIAFTSHYSAKDISDGIALREEGRFGALLMASFGMDFALTLACLVLGLIYHLFM